MTTNKFQQFQLSDDIQRAITVLGYSEPTEVQIEVIPKMLAQTDLIVQSQTGSGKTAAFAIPVCEQIKWEQRRPQALILTPTRELALQIKEDIFNIGRFKRLKVEAIFGRSSFEGQARNLTQRTHVVVATPGRLLDHLYNETIDLSEITTLVIDEADEMMDMGFIEQIEDILEKLPSNTVHALFSATMPTVIKRLAESYLQEPEFIKIASENKTSDRIAQYNYRVKSEEKIAILQNILIADNPDSSILFCNTRVAVEEVAASLQEIGIKCEMLHGGMEQRERTKVINDFKHGYFRYLVATDVAARGLDIADIALVVNVDLPDKGENYIHRIGRTARFENHGKAISLVSEYDGKRLANIEETIGQSLQQMEVPSRSLVKDRLASFEAKQLRRPTLKKAKGQEFKEEIMKLHINAGKKTKMRAGDIVGAICNIEGLTADDIGVISIVDVSTFVEILNGKGSLVLKALQEMPIKGRQRNVNKANETTYEQDVKRGR